MLLSIRTHNAANGGIGPGGNRCPCCAPAPKARKAARRRVRRVERQAWRKDANA